MISRRRFLQSSASLALLPLLPRLAAARDVVIRQNWEVFRNGPMYTSLVRGVQAMRNNHDETSSTSWAYWVNVHKNFCPHRRPYFLAWHRGLLLRFESALRKAAGDDSLVLPYWDYYTQPQMPVEFLDPTTSLYRKNRKGSDVTAALSLDPFDDAVLNFQRGLDNAFEPLLETRPHNPVHNLIGGVMANVAVSPWDPIFWVHHANIDRLWAAWTQAGNGREMPPSSDTYWSGSFNYGTAVKSVPRRWTIATTHQYLDYQYDDESMPTSLPPPYGSTMVRSFAQAGAAPLKPAAVHTVALGTTRSLALDERSISVDVPLSAQDTNRVRSVLIKPTGSTTAGADALRLVLDGVQTTALGNEGGYFYKIFVNLPETAGVHPAEHVYLLGMIGPFEISAARMNAAMQGKGMQGTQGMQGGQATHGQPDARLTFPMGDALRRLSPVQLDKLSISFVRADGGHRPAKGDTIRIKSFRVVADN